MPLISQLRNQYPL